MKAQVRILTGSQTGHTEVFSRPYVGIGRHPASDLRFDPERDLEVSARHAALLQQGANWYVRDLESRNGTFVNGHRIQADTKLDDTDQIKFGPDGPSVEVRLVPENAADGVIQPASHASAVLPMTSEGPRITVRHAPHQRASSTTERIRVAVRTETKRYRALAAVLVLVLVAAAAGLYAYSNRQVAQRELEIAALQARTDSILRTADRAINQLQGQVQGLANALEYSQQQVQGLQSQLSAARRSGDQVEIAALERRLADATQALSYQRAAADVDYRKIVDQNQAAVAMVIVRFPNGDVSGGTGFAVTSDGILITNRHVVKGARADQEPVELGVKFADSDQFYRARLLGVSDAVDLAAIQTDAQPIVPVRGINSRPDTMRQGDPVAIIGFPLGTDLAMDMSSRNRTIARTTFTAGTIGKVLTDNIQVDGYSAVGGSGSPIFDENGQVIAILFGSPREAEGRVMYTVPANYVLGLLRTVGR